MCHTTLPLTLCHVNISTPTPQLPHIVADQGIPFLKGVLEPYAKVTYLAGEAIAAAEVADADVLIVRTRTQCNEALLRGSRVRLIATATIGFDHIDRAYCDQAGISVVTAAGCNARGVLQYVMGALARLSEREGWRPFQRTLGVIGVGNVGSLVAEYGRLWGFEVVCLDPPRARNEARTDFVSQAELLERADIITIHVPLSRTGEDRTFGMVDAAFLSAMRPDAVLINSSRGEVVVEEALCEALNSGQLGGAILDTWCDEPTIDRSLLTLATYATPHIAGYSIQGKAAGTAAVVRAVATHIGAPLTEWYPAGITPSAACCELKWEQMQQLMPTFFDIEAESTALRSAPEAFEHQRYAYNYREEFF